MGLFGPHYGELLPPLKTADFAFTPGLTVETTIRGVHQVSSEDEIARLVLHELLVRLARGCGQLIDESKKARVAHFIGLPDVHGLAMRMYDQTRALFEGQVKGKVKPVGKGLYRQPPLPPHELAAEAVLEWTKTIILGPGVAYIIAHRDGEQITSRAAFYESLWATKAGMDDRALARLDGRLRRELRLPDAGLVNHLAREPERELGAWSQPSAGRPDEASTPFKPSQSAPKRHAQDSSQPNAKGYVKTPSDPDAYRPATYIQKKCKKSVLAYKQLIAILDKHPEIRWTRPEGRSNRRSVHLGDWHKYEDGLPGVPEPTTAQDPTPDQIAAAKASNPKQRRWECKNCCEVYAEKPVRCQRCKGSAFD